MSSTRFRDGLKKKEANMHDSFVHCSLDSRRAQFSEGATNCERYYTTSEMKGAGNGDYARSTCSMVMLCTLLYSDVFHHFFNSFCRHAHDFPAYPSSKAFGFGHQLIKTSTLLKNEGSEAHRRFGTFRGHVSLDSGKSQLRTISAYSDIQHRLNKIGCATFA
uniref:Uncharacterized protein n=1 Tax=Ixodes ricinus TaxID=34613 RepID=A0A6B0UX24_IXORI